MDVAPVETPTEAPAETVAAPVEAVETAPTEVTADLLTQPSDGITPDTSNDPWYNELAEEYRSNPNVTKYQSMDEMAKGLINQASLLGKKGIIKPGEDATEQEMSEYYNALGRPTEANMYKYEPIEGAPDVDQEAMASFQEFAHSKGLNQDQYQAAIEFDLQRQQGAMAQLEQERVQEVSNTRLSIYDEFGETEGNAFIRDAQQAADALGLTDVFIKEGIVNNESVIRALANASKHLGSSSLVGNHGANTMNFEEQIAAIRNSPGYNDKTHHNYQALQDKKDSLYKRRYPS